MDIRPTQHDTNEVAPYSKLCMFTDALQITIITAQADMPAPTFLLAIISNDPSCTLWATQARSEARKKKKKHKRTGGEEEGEGGTIQTLRCSLTYCIHHDSGIRSHRPCWISACDTFLCFRHDHFLIMVVFACIILCLFPFLKDCNSVKWASWPQ